MAINGLGTHFETGGGEVLPPGAFVDESNMEPSPTRDEGRSWNAASSSATRAWITMQRPVRIAVPVARMLPER